MEVLFIDACPRKDSRTRTLAECVLARIESSNEHVRNTCIKLSEISLPDITETVIDRRVSDKINDDFSDSIYDLARQFAKADKIVIAAPFWDLSFPALLKKYIEAISVSGITFTYSEEGMPIGLCHAQELFYVTTAGGPIFNEDYGYGYIQTMAKVMYGIPTCHLFKAENLDVIGTDVDSVMEETQSKIHAFFSQA